LYDSLKENVILTWSHCKDCNMFASGVPGCIAIERELRT